MCVHENSKQLLCGGRGRYVIILSSVAEKGHVSMYTLVGGVFGVGAWKRSIILLRVKWGTCPLVGTLWRRGGLVVV